VKQMTKRKQQKLQKKRKQAKQARKRQAQGSGSLAYHGRKYRTKELVPTHLETELAIHECDVLLDRELTDHDVREALESLVLQVRLGPLPEIDRKKPFSAGPDNNRDVLIWNIREHWDHFFRENPHPGRDKLVGILRSILGSVETWGNPSPASRGYLRFIEGFCAKLGYRVQVASSEEELHRLLEAEDDAE